MPEIRTKTFEKRGGDAREGFPVCSAVWPEAIL